MTDPKPHEEFLKDLHDAFAEHLGDIHQRAAEFIDILFSYPEDGTTLDPFALSKAILKNEMLYMLNMTAIAKVAEAYEIGNEAYTTESYVAKCAQGLRVFIGSQLGGLTTKELIDLFPEHKSDWLEVAEAKNAVEVKEAANTLSEVLSKK